MACNPTDSGENQSVFESFIVFLVIIAVFCAAVYGCGRGLHELATHQKYDAAATGERIER